MAVGIARSALQPDARPTDWLTSMPSEALVGVDGGADFGRRVRDGAHRVVIACATAPHDAWSSVPVRIAAWLGVQIEFVQ